MGSEQERAGRGSRQRRSRASASLLVRCWLEPREGAEPVFRGVVRNLATGEETMIGDPGVVAELLVRQLNEEQPAAAAAERRTSA
jgi:hypothetical protein